MFIARTLGAHHYNRRLVPSFPLVVLMLGIALIFSAGIGHSAQVSLTWDANTESNLAGYKIYYGTAPHDYSWVLDVGKVTTYTVTGLTDGLTYYFAATAYNIPNVESAYSGEVSTNSCTYSISPSSQSFTASAGTGAVNVNTQATCPWTAGSGASWMTITSGSNGTGNGTVRYSISANTGSSSRTASSTMAGKIFTVTQAGTSGSAFIITASAGTGGSISPSGAVSVGSGTDKTFAITPHAGYRVAGVRVDGTSVGAVTAYTFSNVTANHSIAASFAANTTAFTITASAGTGGSLSPSGAVSVGSGTSKTFAITPNAGYRVAGVLVDGTSVGAVTTYTFSNVTANHSIAASFAANTTAFTITASAGTGGSLSPSGAVSVGYGASQAFTITPSSGYRVAGVVVDGTSVGAVTTYTFNNVRANHTIAATFAANTASFTITASAGAGGSISPLGAVSVGYGTSKTFTITPNTGYRLTGLVVDGSPANPVTTYSSSIVTADRSYRVTGLVVDDSNPMTTYTFSNVTAHHTIVASFAANVSTGSKTITASAGTGGSISPSGAVSVSYGASQTFTIKPNTGYRVSRLLVDGISVGAVTTYTFSNVRVNHTIAVTFVRLRWRSATF